MFLLLLACFGPPEPELAPSAPQIEAPVEAPVAEAPITLRAPVAGQIVGASIEVRGTAQVWEGRVNLRLLDPAGVQRAAQSVTASASAPERGAFSLTLQAPPELRGPATVEAYAQSARDGSPTGITRVEILIE